MLHQRLGSPCSSFFLSHPLANSLEHGSLPFLPGLSRPLREDALCLCEWYKPCPWVLLVLCITQGILASLFCFLIIDSGPPGSGPLKDRNTGLAQPSSCLNCGIPQNLYSLYQFLTVPTILSLDLFMGLKYRHLQQSFLFNADITGISNKLSFISFVSFEFYQELNTKYNKIQ